MHLSIENDELVRIFSEADYNQSWLLQQPQTLFELFRLKNFMAKSNH